MFTWKDSLRKLGFRDITVVLSDDLASECLFHFFFHVKYAVEPMLSPSREKCVFTNINDVSRVGRGTSSGKVLRMKFLNFVESVTLLCDRFTSCTLEE